MTTFLRRSSVLSLFPALPVVALVLAACAAPATEDAEDAVEASEDELRASGCELGSSCAQQIPVLVGVDFGPNPPRTRPRLDLAGDDANMRFWTFRQWTSGTLTMKPGTSVALSGATAEAPVEVDDILLFEVLDPTTSARIGAAYAGTMANLRLGGQPVTRLGSEGFQHRAASIDLGDLLPSDRKFRLRVSAIDFGGHARVSAIIAHTRPKAAPAAQWTLAGDASGTRGLWADDDLVVKKGGVEIARGSGSFAPLPLAVTAGDDLRVEVTDSKGGCRGADPVWLVAPGQAPRQLLAGMTRECDRTAASTPFASVTVRAGDDVVRSEVLDSDVLASNFAVLGRDATAALRREVRFTAVGANRSTNWDRSVHSLLRQGLDLGAMGFVDPTRYFDVAAAGSVTPARLDAIVAAWRAERPRRQAAIEADWAAGRITLLARNQQRSFLTSVAEMEAALVQLRVFFDRYPNVASITLR